MRLGQTDGPTGPRRDRRAAGPDAAGCPTAQAAAILDGQPAARAGRRRADPVRRRDAEDAGRTRRICSRPTWRRATGSIAYAPIRRPTGHPLSLISPASAHTISSTLGELRPAIARLKIHPADAHRANDRRRRSDPRSSTTSARCTARRTSPPEVRPGTVSLAEGSLGAQHVQRRHGQRARARFAHGHRRRRVLQRRARAGGAAGAALRTYRCIDLFDGSIYRSVWAQIDALSLPQSASRSRPSCPASLSP